MIFDVWDSFLEPLGALVDFVGFPGPGVSRKATKRWQMECEARKLMATQPSLLRAGEWAFVTYRPAHLFQKLIKDESQDTWGILALGSDALRLWVWVEPTGELCETEVSPVELTLTFNVKEPLELLWARWIAIRSGANHFYVAIRRGFGSLGAETRPEILKNRARSLYGLHRVR